jgi:hypothetical protein
MCALGCITRPFNDLYTKALSENGDTTSKSLHSTALAIGSVYHKAACKRIGLLDPSIITVQYIFLNRVYEIYLLHLVNAWRYFCDASFTLFKYLKLQNAYLSENNATTQSADIQRLGASLY